jgi:hypothetical protein
MQELAFWKAVIVDESNSLETIIELLDRNHIRYCVIGGQGVNAYVDPLVSLDLDLVVAAGEIEFLESALREDFKIERFPYSLNISATGSKLRVQVQTDPRYASFLDRARPRQILGITLSVASLEDILQGKVWAEQDPLRRRSKRHKDLLDIERIVEAYPALRAQVPPEILERLAQS